MAEVDFFGDCPEESAQVAADWLQNVKRSIRRAAYSQSVKFCYDFEADKPILKPDGAFQWTVEDEKPEKLAELPRQRSSLSTITSLTSELDPSIPPIPEMASGLSFGRPSSFDSLQNV